MNPLSRFSRRQRRTFWTAGVIVLLAIAGGTALAFVHHLRQTNEYKPGEANADITQSLVHGRPREAPTPKFTDVTAEAGLADFITFAGDRSSQLPEDMGSGAAWGDYDNDGDDDLFLVSAGGALTVPTRSVGGEQTVRERRLRPLPPRRRFSRASTDRSRGGMGRRRWRRLYRSGCHRLQHAAPLSKRSRALHSRRAIREPSWLLVGCGLG